MKINTILMSTYVAGNELDFRPWQDSHFSPIIIIIIDAELIV